VPITLELNSSFFINWYKGSSSSAHCAIQPPMVLREMSMPCRSNIFSCRFSGWWSAHLATITCANKLAPAVLFSIGCGGLVAVLTVQSQAYFRQTS
jgi:hypothetical protein